MTRRNWIQLMEIHYKKKKSEMRYSERITSTNFHPISNSNSKSFKKSNEVSLVLSNRASKCIISIKFFVISLLSFTLKNCLWISYLTVYKINYTCDWRFKFTISFVQVNKISSIIFLCLFFSFIRFFLTFLIRKLKINF